MFVSIGIKRVQSIYKNYTVEKSRIGFLKFIFEAYEGLAVITTLDAKTGLVRFAIAPGCIEETCTILDDLKKDIIINEA